MTAQPTPPARFRPRDTAPRASLDGLRRDLWLADRLGNRALYAGGVTTPDQRAALQRAEVATQGIGDRAVSTSSPETWAQLLDRTQS